MKLINVLRTNRILKSIFVLLSGTIIAQLVPILLQPILRRSYSPQDFGKYALFAAIIEIVVTINTFRLEQAILIPHSEKEAVKLVNASLYTCVLISVFMIPVIPLLHYFTGLSISILLFLPFCSFFFGLINIGNYWYVRNSMFKMLSYNKLIRRFSEGGVQVALGLSFTNIGLFIGSLVGFIVAGVHVIYKLKIKKLITWKEYVFVITPYKSFIYYSVLPALLNILSLFIPLFVFKSKFNDFYTGQFDLTRQVLGLPLVIISGTISQVLVSNVTNKYHHKEKFTNLLQHAFIISVLIAFVLIIIINTVGVDIIVYIFGEKWRMAADLSQVLIWGYSMKFISTCFYNVLIPINKVRVLGWWQVINFFLSLSLFLSFFTKNVSSFCKTYILIEIVSCLVCLIFVFRSAYTVQKNTLG